MTLHALIDFGDLPIFKEAIAYPNILIASKAAHSSTEGHALYPSYHL
jgi:hypothetical protein